ncbi:uncharacterized protein HaLaN_09001 [Haematococcus lacustris]|uniref:Uncharacterized protein n=1 Tax=Haematococcus lacustris TaxID=44745 RepID=A0A699YTM2_HAELA|nr:uncharacterized protein HaLaN_09001 [Haematococcus lacustris]
MESRPAKTGVDTGLASLPLGFAVSFGQWPCYQPCKHTAQLKALQRNTKENCSESRYNDEHSARPAAQHTCSNVPPIACKLGVQAHIGEHVSPVAQQDNWRQRVRRELQAESEWPSRWGFMADPVSGSKANDTLDTFKNAAQCTTSISLNQLPEVRQAVERQRQQGDSVDAFVHNQLLRTPAAACVRLEPKKEFARPMITSHAIGASAALPCAFDDAVTSTRLDAASTLANLPPCLSDDAVRNCNGQSRSQL